jgi:hypothetical protein
MRVCVTAVALLALTLTACSHETELKESPEQVAKEQAAADAHNASTVPSPGDDEMPSSTEPVTSTVPIVLGAERLFTGDCVDQASGDAAEVRDISCSKSHHAEVTERIDVGPRFGGVYPSDKQQEDVRDTECKPAFERYTGHGPTADIGVGDYGPSPDRWSEPSARYMICLAEAYKEGNVLTGSVRRTD